MHPFVIENLEKVHGHRDAQVVIDELNMFFERCAAAGVAPTTANQVLKNAFAFSGLQAWAAENPTAPATSSAFAEMHSAASLVP